MPDSLLNGPPVYLFAECPNCRELLEVDAQFCPRCREEISEEYAYVSSAVVLYNTQAVSLANSISTFDAFIPLALILTVVVYVLDWLVDEQPRIPTGLLVWPLIPLVAIGIWHLRFGRFALGDEEYLRARREMRRSFAFWLVYLMVDVLLLIVAIKTRW